LRGASREGNESRDKRKKMKWDAEAKVSSSTAPRPVFNEEKEIVGAWD